MTDYKKLCAELAQQLDDALDFTVSGETRRYMKELVGRALDALSQPEPEGPSDKELLELMPEAMRDEFSYAAKTCSDATGGQVKPRIFRVCLNTAALEYAQAVLARWGQPS